MFNWDQTGIFRTEANALEKGHRKSETHQKNKNSLTLIIPFGHSICVHIYIHIHWNNDLNHHAYWDAKHIYCRFEPIWS